MNIARIAEKMFKDSFSAWRYSHVTGADGITREVKTRIYKDEPCILFRGGGHAGIGRRAVLSPDAFDDAPSVREAYLLIAGRNAVLQANDEIEVVHGTAAVRGNAGETFEYPSHTETMVNVQRNA